MKSLTKWSMTAGCCMLLGGFSGCDRLFDEKEQPEGSYTISGRLYKGTSDVPYANAALFLEGHQQQGFSDEYVDLGRAVTDEDGFFSITYDRVFKDSKIGDGSEITFRLDETIGGHIKTFPWHTTVNRDFAEQDHSRVFVTLEGNNLDDSDSLYFGVSFLSPNQEYIQSVNFENHDLSVYVAKTDLSTLRSGVFLITTESGTWNNKPSSLVLAYGQDIPELEKAYTAFVHDSVPDDFNRIEYTRRGFPFTDTIKLEL